MNMRWSGRVHCFLSLLVFACRSQDLDECEDKSTDCQPCNLQYPVPSPTRENCMKTCQVCTNVENVALNKPAYQVSTQFGGVASNAVDGRTTGDNTAGNICTHTSQISNQIHWWCVDLGKMYIINNVTIYNRVGEYYHRLQGFRLNTASNGQCNQKGFDRSTLCYRDTPDRIVDIYTVEKCNLQSNKSISAGTIFVWNDRFVALTICEVQAYTGIACSYGYYSTSSSTCEPCDDGCSDNKCNPDTGDCIGECKQGLYGTRCNETCSDGCSTSNCSKDGSCSCRNGFYGGKCSSECSSNCKNHSCTSPPPPSSSSPAQCTDGCVDGFKGSYCQTPCDVNCRRCDVVSCTVCKPGWYGDNCESRCPTDCRKACNKTDGTCDDCKEGTVGLYCNVTCGVDCPIVCGEQECNIACNRNCSNGSCEKCRYECRDGNRTCIKPEELTRNPEPPPNVAIAVSVSVVVLSVLAVTIVVILVFRRRKKNSDQAVLDEQRLDYPVVTEGNSNDSATSDGKKSAIKGNVYENVTMPDEPNVYQNVNPDIDSTSSTRIDLNDLAQYVKQHKFDHSFKDEFQALPSGLCSSYDYGMNSVNKLKNRYKNMCAFDHSRVKLDIENDDPYSDYINACYITGFENANNKYIASQGPVDNMIVEFWRMVWLVDSGKIVMLTNIKEMGVQKCLQYWPNEGKLKTFGNISIRLLEESVFSHFTVRKLKVEKEGWDPRYVEQFHYTAWPDKSIPRDIPSLLEFTYKVNQTPSSLTGPLVVHCSAGIGRTGTFIALDYLIEEGKMMESVDVVKCLEQMRYERVNVVQNAEQYILLHEALAVAFACGDTISVATCQADILKLVKENKPSQRLKELLKNIEAVCSSVTKDNFNAAMSEGNRHKNRDMSILPLDEFRLFLPYGGEGSSDYINAVSLPSYRKKSGYIITQTPLQETIADFWKMLVEAEVEIVVNMDSTESHDNVGDYVPENGQLLVGDFTVTKLDEKLNDNGFYSVLTLSVEGKNNTDAKKIITFYQCRFWKSGKATPSEVSPILTVLDDVQSTSSHTDNNGPPMAVMCLNGATKSGLFCVLAAVIERLNIEQRVNVLLTILQLRLYRPQIITTPDQLKCCVDAISDYVGTFSTYANS